MEDKICIPLSLPREAFVMRSNCNMIGQYLNNNRKLFGAAHPCGLRPGSLLQSSHPAVQCQILVSGILQRMICSKMEECEFWFLCNFNCFNPPQSFFLAQGKILNSMKMLPLRIAINPFRIIFLFALKLLAILTMYNLQKQLNTKCIT